jgi:hypothetical protein
MFVPVLDLIRLHLLKIELVERLPAYHHTFRGIGTVLGKIVYAAGRIYLSGKRTLKDGYHL